MIAFKKDKKCALSERDFKSKHCPKVHYGDPKGIGFYEKSVFVNRDQFKSLLDMGIRRFKIQGSGGPVDNMMVEFLLLLNLVDNY